MKLMVCGLTFFLVSSSLAGTSHSTAKNTTESDEAMIDQVEQMGKTIQQALSKLAEQFRAGDGKSSQEMKATLEQLARQVEKGQKAPPAKGRVPGGAPGMNSEMMKALQSFVQQLGSKTLENVNDTVKKLDKMADEAQ